MGRKNYTFDCIYFFEANRIASRSKEKKIRVKYLRQHSSVGNTRTMSRAQFNEKKISLIKPKINFLLNQQSHTHLPTLDKKKQEAVLISNENSETSNDKWGKNFKN